LDLHHLKYFLVAAEEGTFHRAAERLTLAPSALSRRIQDLEAELDIALFERVKGSVRLSPAGRIFAGYTRRILAEVDATADHLRRLARGQSGVLRIGLNGIAPQLAFVPAVFRKFRAAHPETELKLISMNSESQIEALRDRALDIGFLYTRPEDDAEFEHLRLRSHRFVLALPPDHRLAGADDLTLADLADEDFVLFTRDSGRIVYDRVMANCRARGLEPRVAQETVGEHMQLGLVAAGMGISFVNESVVARQVRPDLVYKRVTDLTVEEHLDLTWRRDHAAAALVLFVEMVRCRTTGDETPSQTERR
jgi:DNA-binding transcriptional LysR family regulator